MWGSGCPSVLSMVIYPLSSAHQLRLTHFIGGNDVFVDIGDKSWGVMICQNYFGSAGAEDEKIPESAIKGDRTLHVGDQFLSAGSNDFKARVVGTTAWIASPSETVELLDELQELMVTKEARLLKEKERLMKKDLIGKIDQLFQGYSMK